MSTDVKAQLRAAKVGSDLEQTLLTQIRIDGLPEPTLQFRFCEGRRFAFDIAWPDRMVACEAEGGVYNSGWHQSIERYTSDCEKYSLAAIAGWRVIRATGGQIETGQALRWIEQALGATKTPAGGE